MFKLFFHLLVVFSAFSCGTAKKNRSCSQTDRLFSSKHISIQTASAPASCAGLAVPLSALQQLPSGASFAKRDRQATAHIRYARDTVYITATCDSLQQLLVGYEQTLDRLSQSQHQQHTERRSPPRLFYLSAFAGVMAIVVAGWRWRR